MRVFYYSVTKNFGDHMNSWLWRRVFPDLIEEQSGDVLVGIGSLIKSDLSKVPGKKIIFGTGSGYGPMPVPEEIDDWNIYFVRGPLTARLLKLPPSKALVDGAWLVDQLEDLRYRPQQRRGVVFVPHWTTDLYANWRQPCEQAGVEYVSPFLEGSQVFKSIATAEVAVVESLHGAIMADYYRVPWIPVVTRGRVLSFKWLDFCQSLGLAYRPIELPLTDGVERLLGGTGDSGSALQYLPEQGVPDLDRIPYAPRQRATWSYRAAVKAKALARPLRASAMRMINGARRSAPIKALNRGRSEELASLLHLISQTEPYLSSDRTREEKLNQLKEMVHRLERDYGRS